jgi:hypothetical protein
MKYTPSMRVKSLVLVMLTLLMATTIRPSEAAPQSKDLFSILGEVESMLKTVLEPKSAKQNLNFEETVMKDDGRHAINSTHFENVVRAHIVGEDTRLYSLWDEKWFTSTIWNVYLTAFQSGLKLSSFYDYSSQCISGFQAMMDSIYFLQKNITSVKSDLLNNWNSVLFNVSNIVAGPMATTVYQCYLFLDDVEDFTKTRWSGFSVFTDMYTSFLFNLLSQSLQLKTYFTNVETYSNQGNIYSFAETIAKIIRITFDFESSESSSLNSMSTIRATRALKQHSPSEYRKDSFVNQLFRGVFKAVAPAQKHKPVHMTRYQEYEGLTASAGSMVMADAWAWDDYVQFGLGTIDGALQALPTGNNGIYCNKNSTLYRNYLTTTMSYFDKNDVKNGMKNFNNMITLTDEITNTCYYFIAPYVTLNVNDFFAGDTLL